MFDYRQHIDIAYKQLLGEGFLLFSTSNEEVEKARLTRRAAWLIHQINNNIGLLEKTSGNQVLNLSVDIILDKSNGDFTDIASSRSLGNGFVEIIPVWVPRNDPTLIPRWVEPTAGLAGIITPEIPPTEPTAETELQQINRKLDLLLEAFRNLINMATQLLEKR